MRLILVYHLQWQYVIFSQIFMVTLVGFKIAPLTIHLAHDVAYMTNVQAHIVIWFDCLIWLTWITSSYLVNHWGIFKPPINMSNFGMGMSHGLKLGLINQRSSTMALPNINDWTLKSKKSSNASSFALCHLPFASWVFGKKLHSTINP